MNVLQIVPELNFGGVETGTVDLSRELVRKGQGVIVISNGGEKVKELLDMGARHITLPVHKKSLGTILKMVKKVKKIIEEENVDIVHARSRVPAIIGFFAARETQAVFITTAHGYYSNHIASRVMGWGRFVIVASNIIGRHMMEDFGVPRERIRFIPRGVDLEKFIFKGIDISHAKSEYKIGIVGRLTPIKGHAFFLQAIARVVRVFPKVKILIVGDAPQNKPEYKENLVALIYKLGIEDFVEFSGFRQDMPGVMSEIDLLVLSSVGQEAFGRVIIEAGASGVPVIATRIGGVVDIIEDGRTGMLVNPGDIMAMMDSILKLLKDRALAKHMAAEARKKVEKEYSLKRMTENTLKVYEEAMDKKEILIIKIGAIGDVILSVPSIRAVRNNFPNAVITVLIGSESRQVLKRCPYLDNLIVYDRKDVHKGMAGLVKISSIIRKKCFSMSIDLQNNRASRIIAWLGAIPRRFGYSNKKLSFLVNNRVNHEKRGMGPVEEQFRLLNKAGMNTISSSKRLELWPGKKDFLYVDDFLKNEWVREKQILVGVNVGSSWQTKRWPLDSFAELADMLAEYDIRLVVTGSMEELPIAKELLRMTRSKVINAVGKTNITQLAALIKRCKIFITGDSAPMHIASSMGINFIALFGPTDPKRHFEPTEKGVVIKKDSGCSPCYKAECKDIKCMHKISPQEIFKIVMEKIGNSTSLAKKGPLI